MPSASPTSWWPISPAVQSARAGVYYEAGLAQGLNLPVIFTCHQDCFSTFISTPTTSIICSGQNLAICGPSCRRASRPHWTEARLRDWKAKVWCAFSSDRGSIEAPTERQQLRK